MWFDSEGAAVGPDLRWVDERGWVWELDTERPRVFAATGEWWYTQFFGSAICSGAQLAPSWTMVPLQPRYVAVEGAEEGELFAFVRDLDAPGRENSIVRSYKDRDSGRCTGFVPGSETLFLDLDLDGTLINEEDFPVPPFVPPYHQELWE